MSTVPRATSPRSPPRSLASPKLLPKLLSRPSKRKRISTAKHWRKTDIEYYCHPTDGCRSDNDSYQADFEVYDTLEHCHDHCPPEKQFRAYNPTFPRYSLPDADQLRDRQLREEKRVFDEINTSAKRQLEAARERDDTLRSQRDFDRLMDDIYQSSRPMSTATAAAAAPAARRAATAAAAAAADASAADAPPVRWRVGGKVRRLL